MNQLIIMFKSRNELYGFARILKTHNVFFSIINTPKRIASSCTLSIKTDLKNFNLTKQLLLRHQPKTFVGIYSFQSNQNGEQILRLM